MSRRNAKGRFVDGLPAGNEMSDLRIKGSLLIPPISPLWCTISTSRNAGGPENASSEARNLISDYVIDGIEVSLKRHPFDFLH